MKDSRESTKNIRPFRLDVELMQREYALAASLVSRDKGKSKNFHHKYLHGKFGSTLASSSVAGIHPITMDMWSASRTGQTWRSSQTGWRAYSYFCDTYYDSPPIIKPTIEVATHFVGYLYKLRGREGKGCSANTVANYISHVRARFNAMGWKNLIWFDPRLTAILNGARHMDQVKVLPENRRRVITFDILRIYADSLAREPMKLLDYLNVWLASLVFFWCCFRPSDILPASYNVQACATSLRWGDVRVKNPNSYTILVRSPKVSEKGGDDVVNLVRFQQEKGRPYCPLYYFDFLMAHNKIINRTFYKHEFVFRNEDGRPMLQKHLNYHLQKHLWPLFPDSFFSCYSIRAGLLNDYAEYSDLFTQEELRSTGKWMSDAMMVYLRTSGKRRDSAVAKIQGIFDKEVIII